MLNAERNVIIVTSIAECKEYRNVEHRTLNVEDARRNGGPALVALTGPTLRGGRALFGDFDGLEQAAGFVERFLIFGGGLAVGDDARAGLNVGLVALHDDRAESDASIHVAGEIDVADGAGVWPAAVGFQLVDDLHGADLGSAGDRARREAGAEGVENSRGRRRAGR